MPQDTSRNSHTRPGVAVETRLRRYQLALGYAVVGIFILLCAWYVDSHWADFAFLSSLLMTDLLAAGLLIAGAFLVSAYQFGLFLRYFGLRLGPAEVTALTMAICLGNLIIPMRGGTGLSALYLKKVHGLDFQSFAVIYAGTGLLIALINTGLALAGLAFLFFAYDFGRVGLTLIVAGLFSACMYLSVFPPPVTWKRTGILGRLLDATNSWRLLTRNRPLLLKLTVSFSVAALALAGSFYFIYRAMGLPMSCFAALVVSGLGNIANLAAFTPGALGIFDAVVIEVPQLLGLDPARSIAGAALFRAACFLWAAALGIPGMLYLAARERAKNGPEQ